MIRNTTFPIVYFNLYVHWFDMSWNSCSLRVHYGLCLRPLFVNHLTSFHFVKWEFLFARIPCIDWCTDNYRYEHFMWSSEIRRDFSQWTGVLAEVDWMSTQKGCRFKISQWGLSLSLTRWSRTTSKHINSTRANKNIQRYTRKDRSEHTHTLTTCSSSGILQFVFKHITTWNPILFQFSINYFSNIRYALRFGLVCVSVYVSVCEVNSPTSDVSPKRNNFEMCSHTHARSRARACRERACEATPCCDALCVVYKRV